MVFDTTVLYCAVVTRQRGPSRRLLSHSRLGRIRGIGSPYILDELRRALLERGWSPSTVEGIIGRIGEAIEVVAPPTEVLEEVKGACRDPEDDPILALAKFVKADFIATHDRDLLDPGEFEGAGILKPEEILRLAGFE